MLTPMLVQYVTGLCCVRRNPDAVQVMLGNMVPDVAAGKARDVDVTVTLDNADGSAQAFKAYEVKREGEPLDVATVEQLIAKLKDMPNITDRAIVSASGFTSAAIAKASAHGTALFSLKEWTKPLDDQFPAFKGSGPPQDFLRRVTTDLLYWTNHTLRLAVPDARGPFTYPDAAVVYAPSGAIHEKYPTLSSFTSAIVFRSTEILFTLEPAKTVRETFPPEPLEGAPDFVATPHWPHTHTLDVRGDDVYLKIDNALCLVAGITIAGHLQWQRRVKLPSFFVMESVPGGEAFAGVAIAEWGTPDGKLMALTLSPESRAVGIDTIRLSPKHTNAIRELAIHQRRTNA